jgi:hypothetical protein
VAVVVAVVRTVVGVVIDAVEEVLDAVVDVFAAEDAAGFEELHAVSATTGIRSMTASGRTLMARSSTTRR